MYSIKDIKKIHGNTFVQCTYILLMLLRRKEDSKWKASSGNYKFAEPDMLCIKA